MKNAIIVLFLVLGFSLTQSFAQRDQITTQAGEKIRCRILDETPSRFIYAYLSPTGKVLRNEIFKNLVTEFKYNFYESDIVTKGNKLPGGVTKEETPAPTTPKADTPKAEDSNKATENKSKKSKRAEKKEAASEKDEVANNAKEEAINKDKPSEKTTQPDNKKDGVVTENKDKKKSAKETDTKKVAQPEEKKDGAVSDTRDEKKGVKETDTKKVAQPEEKKDGAVSDARDEKKDVKKTDTKKVAQPTDKKDEVTSNAKEEKKSGKEADTKNVSQPTDKKDEVASDTKEEKKASTKKTSKKGTQPADTKKKDELASNSKEEKKPKKERGKTEAPLATKKEKNEFDNYLKFRLGVRGGFGNMLAKLDTKDAFGLYQEKLLRGWTWGADAAFFPTDVFGFGIMFNNFQSKNSAENIKYQNILLNEEATGSISNKRSTKFVGPVFYFRKNIDYKTMVILGLAPGAYFYNDKGTYDDAKYTFKGMDFGAAGTLGIDFLLGNDISGRDIILSLEAGYNYGKMRALNLGDGKGARNLSTPLDLSRVDFTVGLRFTRYPKYLRN